MHFDDSVKVLEMGQADFADPSLEERSSRARGCSVAPRQRNTEIISLIVGDESIRPRRAFPFVCRDKKKERGRVFVSEGAEKCSGSRSRLTECVDWVLHCILRLLGKVRVHSINQLRAKERWSASEKDTRRKSPALCQVCNRRPRLPRQPDAID